MKRSREDEILCAFPLDLPTFNMNRSRAEETWSAALKFCLDVLDTVGEKSSTYRDFLKVMDDFKFGKITRTNVDVRLERIFENHPHLLRGFFNFRYGSPTVIKKKRNSEFIGETDIEKRDIKTESPVETENILDFIRGVQTRLSNDLCILSDMLNRYENEKTPIARFREEVNYFCSRSVRSKMQPSIKLSDLDT